MKPLIGTIMLVVPFVVLFMEITVREGILDALAVFGTVIFIVAWFAVAFYFLTREK